MSIIHHSRLPAAASQPSRRSAWTKLLAIAAATCWLTSVGASAQGPPLAKTGETRGLKAKFVDVKAVGTDIRTRYYEVGQGEPMVLVHGGGFNGFYSANHWDKAIPGLGKRFHVFAPDKLAAGMTENPGDDKDYSIQGEVEHIYQFIKTMKLGKVHLVGQSRGAGLTLILAALHPDVVKTLTLVNSGTATPEEACPGCSAAVRATCPDDPYENWKCLMRNLCYDPDRAMDDEYWAAGAYMASLPKSKATVSKTHALAAKLGRRFSVNGLDYSEYKKALYERLKSEVVLPMPVLLLWAKDDPQAPALKNGVMLYDIIAEKHPNVRMFVMNKAGHFWWREYPEEFNHQLVSFIDYWSHQPIASSASR